MRSMLLVAAIIVLTTSLISGQSANQKAAIEQEIRKLDLAHADAVLRGDLAALDKLWTKDFKVNNPFNEIDKADPGWAFFNLSIESKLLLIAAPG